MRNAIMMGVGIASAVGAVASTAYCIKHGAIDEVKEMFHKDKPAPDDIPWSDDDAVVTTEEDVPAVDTPFDAIPQQPPVQDDM